MPILRRKRHLTVLRPDTVGSSWNALKRSQSQGSLTAAGFRVKQRNADTMRRLIQPWQARAFSYYDALGEIKYASQFYARMLAPLELYAGEFDENDDLVATENEQAKAALARIQDPGGGRTNLLSAYGRLMFIAGECYLFVSRDENGDEQWEMLSTDELRVQGSVYVRYKAPSMLAEEYREPDDDGSWEEVADREAIAYRLWQRHPRYAWLADSTMQGVLSLCEELLLLEQAVRARARNRLAGPGLLLMPEELTPVPLGVVPDEDPEEDPFLQAFTEAITKPIVDEGSASGYVPLVIRGAAEWLDKIKHLQIVDPMQLYPETGLRYECIKRIAIGLDMPPEALLGLQDLNHWPCDEQTEVFTADRGFVRHDGLAVGDVVLSLNHETGQSEWVPLSGVRREHVTGREMVRVITPAVDALTTREHRWPVLRHGVREWTDGDGLLPDDRVIRAAPHGDLPVMPIHDDAFVELVAWYVTEGTCTWPSDRHCQVRIGQSHRANPDNVSRIRQTLTSLYGGARDDLRRGPGCTRGATTVTAAWREAVEERGMTLFHLNKTAYSPLLDEMESPRSKVASREFVLSLTRAQLLLFLETFALGDGELRDGGGLAVNQRDPRRLEPVTLAAVLAGRPVSFKTQERRGGFSDGTQHYLNVPVKGVSVPAGHTMREVYTGVIFCPQVPPTSSFLARRNGTVYYTGNSSWQVDEQTWKAHGQPKAQQLADDLTSSYFRPALREMGLAEWKRYAIGYDASAIVNHPDRTKDAKDLYDRRAIGKPALREATGFDEDDAPTEAELNEMIGVQVRDGSLALYGIPMLRGQGGIEPAAGEIETGAKGTGGVVSTPSGPTSGAEVEPGPPPQPEGPDVTPGGVVGAGNGDASVAWRIIGAADMALARIRESVGNRIANAAKRDPALAAIIDGVRRGEVAAALGADRVRALRLSERDLVAAARPLIEDSFRLYQLDESVVARLASLLEQHAARTLYERLPPSLPQAFLNYVFGLTHARA